MPLKYLFTADFKDGKVIEQRPEDKSSIDPEKRSTFYDVMQEIEKGNPLLRFELRCVGPAGAVANIYSVDLRDGHFETNGLPFRMHEEDLRDFRIVFFRGHTHTYATHQGKPSRELSHTIVYRMGWQATQKGVNYQRVMQLD